MDEEIAELAGEYFSVEDFDIDYEFDAPRYFDFSRPETNLEAREAELWFQLAGSYPPSPLNRTPSSPEKYEITSPESEPSGNPSCTRYCLDTTKDSEAMMRDEKYNGFIYYNEKVQDIPKATCKSQVKSSLSRNSNLLKPTACLLARLNQPLDVYSIQLLRRCQRSLGKFDDKSSQNSSTISSVFSSLIQSQDIKRQKLEAGYLRKIYGLHNQALLVHKEPKQAGLLRVSSANGRTKVTIPREPEFKTAQRAERHRSKINLESAEHAKPKSSTSNVHPVNGKIMEASSRSSSKRSTPRLQDCQAFHLRTSERAMQRASNNARTMPSDDSLHKDKIILSTTLRSPDTTKEKKCKEIHKSKVHQSPDSKACPSSKKESERLPDKSCQDETLEKVFSKLSMKSERHLVANSHPTLPVPGEIINMVPRRYKTFNGKQCPCGSDRKTTEIMHLLTINRSVDIC